MDSQTSILDNFPSAHVFTGKSLRLLKTLKNLFLSKQIHAFKSFLHKEKNAKNVLFQRGNEDLSLFEEILMSTSDGASQFISLIWVECALSKDLNLWSEINSLGKLPIQYTMDSSDNFFTFLVYDIKAKMVKKSSNQFEYHLKAKNEQFLQSSKISIFTKIYQIVDIANLDKCMIVLEELLKEMNEIFDIKMECNIDFLLQMKDDVMKEKLLKLLVMYWKVDSTLYKQYRGILEDISPYFNLHLTLKENNEKEFIDFFSTYLEFMKEKDCEDYQRFLVDECKSLLQVADQGHHKRAINLIVGCFMDENEKNSSSSDYTNFMLKLIQNDSYLGNTFQVDTNEDKWIEVDILEQYLDYCVTSNVDQNENKTIHIDYNFLVDPEIQAIESKNLKYKDENLHFNRSMIAMTLILNNDKLRHLITHPVLALFADLKNKKYQKIHSFNLYAFLVLFAFPFFLVFMGRDIWEFDCPNELGNRSAGTEFSYKVLDSIKFYEYDYIFIYVFAFISNFYLILRELIQLLFFSESKINYFKQKSNILEIMLIIASCTFAVNLYGNYRTPAAFLIMLICVEILMLLPTSTLSTYMFMLKTVSVTFMKFFWIFLVIIIAFTYSFYALFRPFQRSAEKPIVLDQSCSREELNSFYEVLDSFIKTTLMLAGNISLEPNMLETIWEKVIFFVFLITALVLLNLINGLAISDIQELRNNAQFLNIKQQIRTSEENEDSICKVYWKLRRGTETPEDFLIYDIDGSKSRLSWWRRAIMKIMTSVINQFPFLHKIDNLVIDCKLRTVNYRTLNKEIHPILMKMNGSSLEYHLTNENYEKLIEILKKREKNSEDYQNSLLQMNEKLDLIQKEMKRDSHQLNEMNMILYQLMDHIKGSPK